MPRDEEQVDTHNTGYVTLSRGETYWLICLYVTTVILEGILLHFVVKVNTHVAHGVC